ncbi:MAG: RICIN domain-containing protein [Rhodospirillaceae bacterium]|nr:RICIN domain-containing protein [Rhodospirillaceae bacterium]
MKWPNRVYSQLIHNGSCLTTPFHLATYDAAARKAHTEKLTAVAMKHPSDQDSHLTLTPCRNDGKGQLWKVVKDSHDKDGVHGFKLQERDSAYCLRPGTVKAQTKKKTKEVKGVFYPCNGVAHGTFELTVPNNSMPIWYDHNGVIKSDNGFCLDVPNDPAAAADKTGSVVYLKTCANDEYDRWDYVVEYDKTVKIINDFTGHCLYPYEQAEGAISSAAEGQLVQRPCDGRYGQNWKMRIIPKQKWFQLEAIDKDKKATNTCMVAEKWNPGDQKVNVFVKACNVATRGRWEFGHWKGTYQWAEWTSQNASEGGSESLSTTYWVSADSLQNNNKNGVCRVIIGDQNAGDHAIYAGTWRGAQCAYVANSQIKNLDPSQPGGGGITVEVLTGMDIGVSGATASWKSSAGGIPTDSRGANQTPPAPLFSSFLVGGDATRPATYLCRVKLSGLWHYGYQASGAGCLTDAGTNVRTDMKVLVFATVQNQDTGN